MTGREKASCSPRSRSVAIRWPPPERPTQNRGNSSARAVPPHRGLSTTTTLRARRERRGENETPRCAAQRAFGETSKERPREAKGHESRRHHHDGVDGDDTHRARSRCPPSGFWGPPWPGRWSIPWRNRESGSTVRSSLLAPTTRRFKAWCAGCLLVEPPSAQVPLFSGDFGPWLVGASAPPLASGRVGDDRGGLADGSDPLPGRSRAACRWIRSIARSLPSRLPMDPIHCPVAPGPLADGSAPWPGGVATSSRRPAASA